jgi:L-ascorbate metabolism protein UlaG (beta-lactamase superfamily)
VNVRWFGQSAFLFTDSVRVAIDPFANVDEIRDYGHTWAYPAIENVDADLVLVTHEDFDHNGVEAIGGSPQVIRSTVGRFDSPAGEIIGIASEHDTFAGTQRGANTIFLFTLDGLRVCHLGDFGQAELRAEQRRAIGEVDLLLIPVGGGATVDGAQAASLVRELSPRIVFPMHYRTDAIDFLEPADAFLQALTWMEIEHLDASDCDIESIMERHAAGVAVVLAPPR